MNTSKQKTPLTFFSRYFFEGIFVLLPLTLTIASAAWLANFFSRQLGPSTLIGTLLKNLGIRVAGDSVFAYSIGWAVVIGFIFLLGFIVDIGARKYIKLGIDSIMQRIPLINRLYRVAAQIVNMVNKREHGEFNGMSVVYCVFGVEKGATFLALMPTATTYRIRGLEHHVVLIPTAPIPMGGGLMMVPVDSVEPAGMSIDDFMQIYVSMGAASDTLMKHTDII